MPSWGELESRFRELESSMEHIRVDGQWGSAGEYWRLAGGNDIYLNKRFEALSKIAGEKLRLILLENSDPPQDIVGEEDSCICWYKGVGKISRTMKTDYPGEQFDNDGHSMGLIYTGHIDRIAEASAIFCLELESKFPEPVVSDDKSKIQLNKPTKSKYLWETYGSQIVIGVIVTILGGVLLMLIIGK